jgi:hypothetical protein
VASEDVALLCDLNRQHGKSNCESKRVPPPWGSPLLEADYVNLGTSWISRDIADAAMLRRVDTYEGREIVGQKGTRDCEGTLFSYYWPDETHAFNHRLRRDQPDYVIGKGGKAKPDGKYLSPPNGGNRLYIPPGISAAQLADVQIPIALVEGEKKGLALFRLALHEVEALRFVPIALPGAWSWRGRIGKTSGPNGERLDVKGPIPDLDRIPWEGRTVFIIYDSNVSTNESVNCARRGIALDLSRRKAKVQLVTLPECAGVNGVDDLLAAWGPQRVLELFEQAVSGVRCEIVPSPQFTSEADGMYRVIRKGEVQTKHRLTTFAAEVTANIILDDGVETSREFRITAELMAQRYEFTVTAAEFSAMEWPIKQLGVSAITFPNQLQYARTAIQNRSFAAEHRRIYMHTGWRNFNGRWVYLHAQGALDNAGAVSDINIRLSGQMQAYALSLPSKDALVAAVRASLRLVELAPPTISFPLLAATYRAILKHADFAIHVVGETGAFKSELAALHQQHFGPAMNSQQLPGTWSSTANALEVLTFLAKDALIVLDDFAPRGSSAEIARYHATADRVFRAAGNHAGRSRLDSSANLRDSKPPRSLILSTGEDVPRGHSVRARLLILELPKGSIDTAALSICQSNAAEGLFCQSLSAFVRYVAGDYAGVVGRLDRMVLASRDLGLRESAHARTPDIIANLQAGFELFIEFAEDHSAIDSAEHRELSERCKAALGEVARAQSKHHAISNPAKRFVAILASLLASGRVHFQSRHGGAPRELPQCWGWTNDSDGSWNAHGPCVGWVGDEDAFLDSTAAFGAVQAVGRDLGETLSVTELILRRRLRENGLLASVDEARGTLTVRRSIMGATRDVLHLTRSTFVAEISDAGEDVA